MRFEIVSKIFTAVPELKGHLLLKNPLGGCICNTCIRAHYEMLRSGELGHP